MNELMPAPPDSYSYDYMNTEVLLTRISVKDGRLELPDSMSYRVLVLPEDVDQLTIPVLHKIRDLVAAGATGIASRPEQSPSPTRYTSSDDEGRAIANAVWGGRAGKCHTHQRFRKGEVCWG